LPAIAIVPFFFAGSLFPITALPSWLADVARVLPLTHALALFRYGLTSTSRSQALHNIWGMHSAAAMAVLSRGVVALYAMVTRSGDPAFHQDGSELTGSRQHGNGGQARAERRTIHSGPDPR
jgi:hypothetical protein